MDKATLEAFIKSTFSYLETRFGNRFYIVAILQAGEAVLLSNLDGLLAHLGQQPALKSTFRQE